MTQRERRVPEKLKVEILDLYQQNMERPSNELLFMLNAPHRVQERGFIVEATHLLGVIIDTWHIGPKSRFALYDYDMQEMHTREVYHSPQEATEEIRQETPEVQIIRFEV